MQRGLVLNPLFLDYKQALTWFLAAFLDLMGVHCESLSQDVGT